MNLLKKFIVKGIFITLLLAVIGYFLFTGVFNPYYQVILPFVLLFIFLFTTVIHTILLKTARKEPKKLVNRFLMLTGLKMMIYLLFMIIYLVISKQDSAPFLLTFLIVYLVFSIFEILSILSHLKRVTHH
ncbi:hypothetical protein ES708_01321 [subsurface metagenome]